TLAVGEEVELLAQRVERDLQVLDDGVGLVLLLEGIDLRVPQRVLGHVVEVTDARGLAGLDELLARGCHEEGLHELPRLRDVEEGAFLGLLPHLDDLFPGVVGDVRQRPEGDLDPRILLLLDVADDGLGQSLDLGQGLLRGRVAPRHRYSSSASAPSNSSRRRLATRSRISSVRSPPVASRAISRSRPLSFSSSAPTISCSERATSSM